MNKKSYYNAEWFKEHYRNNRTQLIAADKERKRQKILTLKRERGGKCERCGYSGNFGCLTFHHRDPKTKEFSIGHSHRKLETLRREADKCDLLCLNCHGEIHHDDPYFRQDLTA